MNRAQQAKPFSFLLLYQFHNKRNELIVDLLLPDKWMMVYGVYFYRFTTFSEGAVQSHLPIHTLMMTEILHLWLDPLPSMPDESIYHGGVVLLQPRGQVGALGQHLEQRGSEGAVVVAPHSPQAAELLGHLFVSLQQNRNHNVSPQVPSEAPSKQLKRRRRPF